mgnify:CR=1 FL=1
MLKESGLNVKKTYSFPDHHNYSDKDYSYLLKQKEYDILIITTEKDYSRIKDKMKQNFHYVEVDLEIENKDKFKDIIKSYL